MSLIIKIPNTVFTKNLPKLYRDAVIGPSTTFVYDALNTVSYAKQAAPEPASIGVPSVDKWTNLVDAAQDGLLYSPLFWDEGFVSDETGSFDRIVMKNGDTPATLTKCVGIVWFKHLAGQPDNLQAVVAAFSDILEIRHTTQSIASPTVADNRFYASTSGSALREIPGIDSVASVGEVFQLAVSFDNSNRKAKCYVNGVEVLTWDGFRDLQTPTIPFSLAWRNGVSSAYKGVFYRAVFDTLTDGRTASEIVAMDYSLNQGKFV